MIFLTDTNQATNKTADAFTQALTEAPQDLLSMAMSDAALVAPAPSDQPLTMPAPVAPAAPVAQSVEASTPSGSDAPTAPQETVPPVATPGLRQVQEIMPLLGAESLEEAGDLLLKLSEINKPLAENLTLLLKNHLEESGQQFASIPVELPQPTFDFAGKSEENYDEQTWADLQAAKQDIDTYAAAATYWQQQALAAQSAAPQPPQPSLKDQFITDRAQALDAALNAVPAFRENEAARNLVREATFSQLRTLGEFAQGIESAAKGNTVKAHDKGLLVDHAIGDFVKSAAAQFQPIPQSVSTPATAPAPPAPTVTGPPAVQAALPPAPLPASGSLMDAVLAEIQQLEQAGAAGW